MKLLLGVFCIVGSFVFQSAYSQDKIPSLRGDVKLSIKKGTIECDLYLSELPDISNYVIRINSGLNIRLFRDTKNHRSLYYDVDHKDSASTGESSSYYLRENPGNRSRYLPDEIEFKYGGMYPVVTDSLTGFMSEDWRGNIAFDGKSIRAEGFQSAWYPVLYDMKSHKSYEKVNYDLNISCDDCDVLYVNGSDPVRAKTYHFISDVPAEPAIYCGVYDFAKIGGTWLINSQMSSEQQKSFASIVNSYQRYYETNLNLAYKGSLRFIQTNATSPDHAFSFLVYPTIINVSSLKEYQLNAMFNQGDQSRKKTVAHELAHYYFGDRFFYSNTEFGYVVNEGFAEFLALKVTKNLISDSLYQATIADKFTLSKKLNKYKPLAGVKSEADFGNRQYYLYNYMPIILLAIEKEIGEKYMWKWMKNILLTKTEFTDYSFLERTLETTLFDSKISVEKLKNKYFKSDSTLNYAISKIVNK